MDPLGLFRSDEALRLIIPGQVLYDDSLTAWGNDQYGWAAAYMAGMLAEQVLYVLTLGESMAAKSGGQCIIKEGVQNNGKTVLGKFPDYLNFAEEIGAKRFNIPTKTWNKMTKAEQWAANTKFLNRMIKRGDDVILSNPVKNLNDVSGAFRKELNYLIKKGFRLSKDGRKMIR